MHPNTPHHRPPRSALRTAPRIAPRTAPRTALATALAAVLAPVWAPWATADCRIPPTQPGKYYPGKDLTDANFSNRELSGANFAKTLLDGASFKGTDLTGAYFAGAHLGVGGWSRAASLTLADLSGACFAGAMLEQTEFEFADLTCTAFTHTSIVSAVFGPRIRAADPAGPCRTSFAGTAMNCEFIDQWPDLDLTEARLDACAERLAGRDFSGAHMGGVDFTGITLTGTRWRGAQLRGADFSELALPDSDWTGADLGQALFLGTELDRAHFDTADLREAQLTGAKADGASLREARLSGAAMSGIRLAGADLAGAVLAGEPASGGRPALPPADLSFAYLPNAVLTGAQLAGANLSHADFYGSAGRADKADMQQINLTGANLAGANLAQGQLAGARLDGANLVNTNLSGADLQTTPTLIPASLVKANLQGTDLTQARLQGANLSNAAIALTDGVPLFQIAAGLAADLDGRRLSAALDAAFVAKGYPLPPCSDPALTTVRPGLAWDLLLAQATGAAPGPTYRRFALTAADGGVAVTGVAVTGVAVTGVAGAGGAGAGGDPGQTLFRVAGAFAADLDRHWLPGAIITAFADHGYPLAPCTNPAIAVVAAGAKWQLATTLESLTSIGLGYTGYTLVAKPTAIAVYGSQITVVRADAQGVLTPVPIPVQPTRIEAASCNDATTMPNGRSFGANRQKGIGWDDMMTAQTPPRPPDCIPSPDRWCPPPAVTAAPGPDAAP